MTADGGLAAHHERPQAVAQAPTHTGPARPRRPPRPPPGGAASADRYRAGAALTSAEASSDASAVISPASFGENRWASPSARKRANPGSGRRFSGRGGGGGGGGGAR